MSKSIFGDDKHWDMCFVCRLKREKQEEKNNSLEAIVHGSVYLLERNYGSPLHSKGLELEKENTVVLWADLTTAQQEKEAGLMGYH